MLADQAKLRAGIQAVAPDISRIQVWRTCGDDHIRVCVRQPDGHFVIPQRIRQVFPKWPGFVDQPAPTRLVGGDKGIPVDQQGLAEGIAQAGRLVEELERILQIYRELLPRR